MDSIDLLSKTCNGDVRVALQAIRDAAIKSEIKEINSISFDEIQNATKNTRDRLCNFVDNLNLHQKNIYYVLKEHKKMSSKELYEKCRYMSSKRLPDRSYRQYMDKMEQVGLIKAKGIKRWKMYEFVG